MTTPQKFLYASSAEVFGSPPCSPPDESTPCDPTTPYCAVKAFPQQRSRVYRLAYKRQPHSAILYNHGFLWLNSYLHTDEQLGNTVLRTVSIKIPAVTACALVGPSGAGKSTLVNLVPRFYEFSQGAIKVDGHELRHTDLRRNIAIVSQAPVLFNETIYENVLRPSRSHSCRSRPSRTQYPRPRLHRQPRRWTWLRYRANTTADS